MALIMTPPFTWKQRLQLLFWVALLLLAIAAIVWMILGVPARRSIEPNQPGKTMLNPDLPHSIADVAP
jgi:hypothetical protein